MSNDPDNHEGVVTHLDPDNLECDIKWALGSITTNNSWRRLNSSWAFENPKKLKKCN